MTLYQRLYDGISRTAWGYFFLYFNININNVSILPSFVGFLLFLSAISLLQEEERSLSLLRGMAILLALWHGISWVLSWVGISPEGLWQFVDILICLANLYFHFQLLTNLASIAARYQPEGCTCDSRLLRYRTLQTVMLTAITVITTFYPWLSEFWAVISVILLIVHLIAAICLMKALFDLRASLSPEGTEKH